MSEPANPTTGHRRGRRFQWVVALLLALPYLGLCFPQMYARATPALLYVVYRLHRN